MAKVLLLFCDGIGLGMDEAASNPFAKFRSPYLPFYQNGYDTSLPHDGILIPTAADMGMPGLPQSATGQTALFCGVASAQMVGRHISGFPSPSLRKIIDAHSIFRKLRDKGRTATFANALSQDYFERLGERISATARAQRAGGFAPRMLDDLHRFNAVSHDFTNTFLRKRGYNVPQFTIAQSAEILARIVDEVDFCLFEFILSDQAGHKQDFEVALGLIDNLQNFLAQLLPQLDLQQTTVILSSDHGNMEDLSVKTHTRNFVPTCIWGRNHHQAASQIAAIEQITPTILKLLD